MKRKLAIILLSPVVILAFWFLGVDGSWFVEECPDCLYGSDIYQIRVFTIPIYQQTRVYNSVLQKIAEDIGVPCSHPNHVRWHKHRFWGLLICACPCINGIDRMSGGDDWYDDKARSIVREMAKTHPSLRDTFAVRVLKNHDWKYLRSFVQQVQALRDGKSAVTPNAKLGPTATAP
jgi:hypothetical protein